MKGVEQIEHTLHNLASPKRGHTFWGFLTVLLLATVLVWAKHGGWLKSPNDFMLEGKESFKIYMTSAWHVQHDSSYVHFSGMDYPFGEHILFTGNQPIISASMQWWSRHVFDVSNYVVGILNVLQVLSIVIGAGVIYLLLRKLHLPVWYAGVSALGIAFLSPQYNRFDGQFGLSHIWVLPMLLLLLCRYEERQSRRYQSLSIGILIWFSAQLHFYNLGVAAVFLGFYTLFQILIDRSWRNIWTRISHLSVMILLPFAFLNVWLHWSDYYADRPSYPIRFTDYIGHWEGIFLPYPYFPMYQWIDHHLLQIRELSFEAQAYSGLLTLGFTLWLFFKRRFKLFDLEWETAAYHRVHKNYLRGICFAGFAILLLGLGLPFSINGLEWMLDYLGPFKQFRGLARFTWAFYYAINVLIFYILWNKSQRIQLNEKWTSFVKSRSPRIAQYLPDTAKWSVALIPLVMLCWEAYYFQKHTHPNTVPNLAQKSVVAAAPKNWLNKVDFGRFQALMPLPYYHVGSENIWLEPYYPLYQKLQYTALLTGVPDMGVNMSRSSVGNMVNSIQFALPACETPILLSELPDNRPIALMIEPSQWEDVQKRYEHLISMATPVYQGTELKILALVPDSVRSWSLQQARKIAAEMDRHAVYDAGGGWRSDKPSTWFTYLNFDSITTSEHVFQGKGATQANLGDTTWIWNKTLPKGTYNFSIWIKANEDRGMTQEILIMEKSDMKDNENYFSNGKIQSELKTIVNGWALFEGPFEVKKDNSTIGIFFPKKHANAPFWYDEVMIKESSGNLYRRAPGWVIRNNKWHKLPKN